MDEMRQFPVHSIESGLLFLQETGIGKIVNSFRKHEGNIGPKAKGLITQWKALVPAEEQDGGQDEQQSG